MIMSLENDIMEYKSFEAIQNCLSGIELHDLQCVDVMRMLIGKRAIVSYSTGLGKTVLAAAVMRLLWNEKPDRKFIFLGKYDQLSQTPGKLERYLGRKVVSSYAEAKSIDKLLSESYQNFSVLFLTHDVLRSERFMNDLFANKDQYCGLFIDEAHELSNAGYAQTATILSGMAMQFEFCFALTATPIVSSVSQMSKLMNIVDYKKFPDVNKVRRELTSGKLRIDDYPCFFINRTREDFGSKANYRGMVEFVDPLPHQLVKCGGNQLFSICKGEGAYPQAEALVRLIKLRTGKRGLIYINQHDVRAWVLPFLDEAGIRYRCINGTTSFYERNEIMNEFNEEKSLDVIITSVTTALDLDCNYVVFYEFTVNVKQMIGRAHRGLGDKVLDVIFVVTSDSAELDYFYNNIYEISMIIQGILNQDYSELEQVSMELENAKN